MDEPKEVVTNEDLLDLGQNNKPKESGGYFAMPKPSLGRLAGRASTFIGLSNPKEKPLEEKKDLEINANDTDLIDLDSNEDKIEETDEFKEVTLEEEEDHPPVVKTSFTTANGDGLTFDPSSLSIFDEISAIIDQKDAKQEIKLDSEMTVVQKEK
jgi:hypothetical protein